MNAKCAFGLNLLTQPHAHFSEPEAVARYAEGPPRLVPGFADLLRMTTLLVAERAPENARVLVVGAGGGLELKSLAEAQPGWTFDGVDPSGEMLDLARQTLGPLATRAHFHHGYIDGADEGPFDAATCLLTFHFLPPAVRRQTLHEIHCRLRPGAPFIAAHFSFPQDASSPVQSSASNTGERALWLARYAAFAASSGTVSSKNATPDQAKAGAITISERLHILTPEEDEALLTEAGFTNVRLFYAALAFRGWLAHA
jgi:tRNA (cmo5U34)-methyltransferase